MQPAFKSDMHTGWKRCPSNIMDHAAWDQTHSTPADTVPTYLIWLIKQDGLLALLVGSWRA